MPVTPTITEVYEEYNRQFFKGRLPKISVTYRNIKENNAYTLFFASVPVEIVLNRYLLRSARLSRIVLVHEMAHISVGIECGHGPKFQKELRRLVKQGAYKGLL
jgi:predicted SprT family Zn-dependent metalloprotease